MLDNSSYIAQQEPIISPVKLTWSDPVWVLKRAIWVYFYLLIFEGALRKWFLPGLATPLLIIRDPIALYAIYVAYKHRMFPNVFYIKVVNYIALISVLATLAVGHGNLFVALYGARPMWLHFPLMYIMGAIFVKEDVEAMGRAILWIALPMVVLIGLQFYSPQSAWVNRGVGGNMEGAGFSGSGEFYRPPGTFSFTSGLVQFYTIVAVFVFYFFIKNDKISKFLLYSSAVALLIAIPFSISRSLIFNVVIEILLLVMAVANKPSYFKKILMIAALALPALLILNETSFFQTATGAMTDRYESANEGEGGLENVFVERFLGGMLKALRESTNYPFFGQGIGLGTNVGAQMLYGSISGFTIAEEEWGRLIGEMGPLLGIILILIRTSFAFSMAFNAFKFMRKENFLPWMLIGVGFLTFLQGQWAPPTSVGFSTIMGGMMLAGFKEKEDKPV